MGKVRFTEINGLPLPQGLLDLIDSGHWICPADQSGVDSIFPERGKLELYSLDYMPFENHFWKEQSDPMFIGTRDSANPPGDIDPQLSILIGDLGIGYDQPIALDYRVSIKDPLVLTLKWGAFGHANRWVVVAPDIQSFAKLLGL